MPLRGDAGNFPFANAPGSARRRKPVIAATTAAFGLRGSLRPPLIRLFGDDTIMRDGFENEYDE